MHIICTICNDAVNQLESLYFTKCGHLFHLDCLTRWLDRSRTCPQCRSALTAASMRRVFPTVGEAPSGEDDAAALQAQLDDAHLAVRQANADARASQAAAAEVAERLAAAQEELKSAQARQLRSESAASALRDQLEYVRAQSRDATRLRADNELLANKLNTLQALQKVVEASAEEVEAMLEGYSDARTLAVFATAFKRAVGAAEKARRAADGRLAAARASLAVERARNCFLTAENNKLKELAATEPRRGTKRKSSDGASCQPARGRGPGADLSDDASCPPARGRGPGADLSDDASCPPARGRGRGAQLSDTTTEDTAAAANDVSLGTLVLRIEEADSPYWTLQQAPPALAMQVSVKPKVEVRAQQASTSATSNRENRPAAANNAAANHKYSIFQKAPAPSALDYLSLPASLHADVSYDGLGGHSRPDVFPQRRPAANYSYAPKLTAKHKLRRKPTDQDVGAMIERMNSKKQ